jgi:fatty acid synthase subunit alpha, fungi type
MMNGALQILNTGLVPGNRNGDNIDSKLAVNDMMVFPNRSIQTAGLRAFSLTSFGFGQKGAQVIGVHPKYLFAAISEHEFASYKEKREARRTKAAAFFERAIMTNSIVAVKDTPPYTTEQESQVTLDPTARVSSTRQAEGVKEEWSFSL